MKPKSKIETEKTKDFLQGIFDRPHILGNMLGYSYLSEEHSKWIRYVYLDVKDNTLLAFRGSYKTTAISVVGAIWYLFFFPDRRILIASSTHDNAKKILHEIKAQYIKDNLLMLYRLIDIMEPRDLSWWTKETISLRTRKKTAKEGNLEAVGALTIITSRHYDKIICDDLVVLKDRISKAERERKKDWVRELQSIIEPNGTISYIGTPWHPDDVYSIAPKPIMRPVGTVFSPKLTKERLKEIRRVQGEAFYASQYELKHISDEDRILDNPKWGEYKPKNPKDKIKMIGYLDPAFGGDNYSALTMGGKKDDTLYVKYGNMWRGQIDETYNRVEKLYKKYSLMTLYVESNAAQRLIATELRRRGLHIKEVNNVKNKHLRIMDNVKKNWDRIVFSYGVDDDYMRSVLDYTEDSEFDDAVDSLSGLSQITIGKRGFRFIKIGAEGLM